MAKRPVFEVADSGPSLVHTHSVEFHWFPGMAVSQAQKSINALHEAARRALSVPSNILEISTKSNRQLGIDLSAFNLTIRTVKRRRRFSVECAYQSSKVFERGGPYTDLLGKSAYEAKSDPRLRESGRLLSFRFFNEEWQLKPRTAFYDWLYLNALNKHPNLQEELCSYSAFSDIAFNPEKSLNCQAYAAALYVSLSRRGLLAKVLEDKQAFLEIVSTCAREEPLLFD